MYEEAEFPESLKHVIIQDQTDRARFPRLLKGEIHLWTASLVLSPEIIERLRSTLSPDEKKRTSYFKFEHKQHGYIITQAVLRILISAYLDIEPVDVILVASKKGKPFLINEPSLYFNISNSHEICVYAFSRDSEVGIDIEKIRELPDLDQLIEKNLTSNEKEYFRKNPDHKLSLFFQFWTLKESYLKAIGEGMRLTPENLEFSMDDGNIRLRSVKYGFEAIDWQFKGFTRKGNYTGTLTHKGKGTVIRDMYLS
jgi:4'-phosphopantetheinyl transferase